MGMHVRAARDRTRREDMASSLRIRREPARFRCTSLPCVRFAYQPRWSEVCTPEREALSVQGKVEPCCMR
jgi:hypothetical protein